MSAPDDGPVQERRSGRERRAYVRGGRRRTDWPPDAEATSCPRCDAKEVKFIEATPTRFFWQCHRCKHDWSVRRVPPPGV